MSMQFIIHNVVKRGSETELNFFVAEVIDERAFIGKYVCRGEIDVTQSSGPRPYTQTVGWLDADLIDRIALTQLQACGYESPDALRQAVADGEEIRISCPTIEQAKQVAPMLPWDQIDVLIEQVRQQYERDSLPIEQPHDQTCPTCNGSGRILV